MLPAALGASMAQRELHEIDDRHEWGRSRTILFVGEGSLQVTLQALSDIIREKVNMIIFIINNNGYTIERCIHGRNQSYNDVASWRYLLGPAYFGADEHGEYQAHTYKVETWGEMENVLDDERLSEGKGLHMIEILMDKEDAPAPLLSLLEKQKKAETTRMGQIV